MLHPHPYSPTSPRFRPNVSGGRSDRQRDHSVDAAVRWDHYQTKRSCQNVSTSDSVDWRTCLIIPSQVTDRRTRCRSQSLSLAALCHLPPPPSARFDRNTNVHHPRCNATSAPVSMCRQSDARFARARRIAGSASAGKLVVFSANPPTLPATTAFAGKPPALVRNMWPSSKRFRTDLLRLRLGWVAWKSCWSD